MNSGHSSLFAWIARLLLAIAPLTPLPAQAAAGGVVPEGVWVLNQQRSKKLSPGRQTLWIVKDDGKQLIWVAATTDPAGVVTVNTWQGLYDGPPTVVNGSAMTSQVWSPAPGKFLNKGEIKGLGPYAEECDVSAPEKRFVCRGKVQTSDGVKTWVDDFDWVQPSPHR